MKILVAEDDEIMRESIKHMLKQEGLTVISAENGRDAIDLFLADTPDLVITDILMPFISGLEFIDVIRNSSRQVPIIVLSAMDEEDTVMEAFNMGADDFLTKPVKSSELSIRLKRLMKKKPGK
ncbi:MAG: response regulator [Bacteroidetes bacterium]|nr:response regulator [Bacteroidota bacterium]